jgi:ADP-heptose:LPS heptosyltransferase
VKHTFLLRGRKGFALGDAVLVTALVRDLHLAYPGRYRVMTDTHFSNVWHHNPRVERPDYKQEHQRVDLSYVSGIASSKQGRKHHYLSWFHKDFELKTGVKVPVRLPKGEIFLSEEEEKPLVSGRYWVVLSGGKLDMTTKHWGPSRYQQVVDRLRERGVRFVQVGASHKNHFHPPLGGVLNLVGRADDARQLFTLVKYADGVVCGVTSAMHIAACFDKPCVVVAGGREEPWWEAYVNNFSPDSFGKDAEPVRVEHKYLHTLGLLDCCKHQGCWKARTVPLEDKDNEPPRKNQLCELPVRGPEPVPRCMEMITPEHVVEAVMSYYEDGVIPSLKNKVSATSGLAPLTVSRVGFEPAWLGDLKDGPPPEPQAVTLPPERPPTPISLPRHMMHPSVGGKYTVCVLCYGPHTDLARRCLNSVVHSMPPRSFDLRVACNACPRETVNYVKSLPVTKVYEFSENRLKYPAMRDMFHDPDCKIQTNYVIWFDDDSFVISPLWLDKLSEAITLNHHAGCRLYGAEFLHDFSRFRVGGHRPDLWFRTAPWYRGKDFYVGRQARVVAPNGSTVKFVAGGFWALGTDALRQAGIPDERLLHNGGDITIGEQVRQAGFKTFPFNRNKEFVHTSGAEPRGKSQKGADKRFPWRLGGEAV